VTALTLLWLAAAPVPAIPVEDPVLRREILTQQLLTAQRDTRIWYATWGLFWSATAVEQVASLAWSPRQDRPSIIAYSITTGLGALATLLLPPPALDVERKLGDPEARWVEVYNDEVFNQSLLMHLAVVIFNVAPFLICGVAFKHWDGLNLIGGLVLSEAQVFTHPQLLRRFGVR
jgi:hypothetical protein